MPPTALVLISISTALLCLPYLVSSDGFVELNLVSYFDMTRRDQTGKCCSGTPTSDGVCTNSCNNYLTICLRDNSPEAPNSLDRCISTFATTTFETAFDPADPDLPVQTFDFSGANNRRELGFEGNFSDLFSLHINVSNRISSTNSSLVASFTYPFTIDDSAISLNGNWSVEGFSHPLPPVATQWLVLKWRAKCAKNYVRRCDVLCLGRDDSKDHYVCDSAGGKMCLPGYEDPTTDCVKEVDLCLSQPCQNGGTCVASYGCQCSSVAPTCIKELCRDSGRCESAYGCSQKPLYTCKCDNDFTGNHCQTNNARSKSPAVAAAVGGSLGRLAFVVIVASVIT